MHWRQAGVFSSQIVEDLQDAPPAHRLFIINLPDNINGAYIFRNDIINAGALYGYLGKYKQILAISYHNLRDGDDSVSVSTQDGAHIVSLDTDRTFFMNANRPIEKTFSHPAYEITDFQPRQIRLTIKNLRPDDALMYYSGGHLHGLP
jgi:hypothetical protein